MIKEEDIKELVSVKDVQYPFVSLYLDLSVDRHGKTYYRSYLNKRYKEIATTLSDDKKALENFNRITEKIDHYMENEVSEDTNGLALFASEEPELFKAFELPVSFDNELKLAHCAYLSQLVNASGLADPIATVVGDTRRAYIYISSLGTKISENLIEGGVEFEQKTKQYYSKVYERTGKSFGYASDTTKKDRFEEKITHFFLNDLVTQLSKMRRNEDFNYLVITGVKEFTDLLENSLTDRLRDILIDVSSQDIKQKSDHDLIELTEDIYKQFNREQERTQQQHLIEEILADGLAIAGVEPTINALTNGKVDTLIIGENLDMRGFSCINCIYLTASGEPDECPLCNSEIYECDLKEMMINLAEQFNCDIQVVEEIDEFVKMERVGAILRFK